MEERKTNNYVLGIDIGITSVGYGVIDPNTNEIIDAGVRLFPERTAAENESRRTKRGSRRLSRRRKQRIDDMRALLKANGIITDDFIHLDNPYQLRVKGLTEKLTNEELATALLHITKRRGSSLDVVEDDPDKEKDAQSAKDNITSNEKTLKERNIHVCELQLELLEQGEKIRGHHNNFKTTSYIKEVEALLKTQNIPEDFNQEVIKIISRRREYYEGPGSKISPTPYGRFVLEKGQIVQYDLIEKMRGKCSIFPDEPRMAKMAYSADLHNLLNDLNNLIVKGEKVTLEQKQQVIEKFINQKGSITINQLLKLLEANEEEVSGFRLDKNYKPIITSFEGYKKILRVVNAKENPLNPEIIENKEYVDQIIEILTRYKGLEERIEKIQNINPSLFDNKTAERLANISGVTGYHAFSEKAIKILNPELFETSENQMEVIQRLGLRKDKNEHLKGLVNIPFDEEAILSPVAKRAHNESLKVINALRKRYGEFDSIVIETARDRNSDEQRLNINRLQKRGEELNKKVMELVGGRKINFKTRQKVRLYMEQDGKCLYSGNAINLETLINDPTAYEIDHIIPISISLEDSIQEKVVVESRANALKTNMTPFGYFHSGKSYGWSYEEYQTYCVSLFKNRSITHKKLRNLLFVGDINKFDVQQKFIQRNLVDTRYASRVILNTLTNYFRVNEIDTKVHTIRGSITNMFRNKADLPKNRDEFYHHAIDALIVASIKKHSYLKQVLNVKPEAREYTDSETGEILTVYDEKEFFSEDLIKFISNLRNLDNIKISHKVDRKPNRQFTDETIYGVRKRDNDFYIIAKYKDIYGPEGEKVAKRIREGKGDALLMAQHDPKSYELLVKIVYEYNDPKIKNPFAAYFEEHGYIRKYSKKGNGPIIKSLKYSDKKCGNHVDISHNYQVDTNKTKVVLLQVSPFRTDFYLSPDGLYKFLTVRYVNIKPQGNKFVIDREWYEAEKKRKKITDQDEFQFSLNRNEYFRIVIQEKDFVREDMYRFVATGNDKTNVVEARPIHRHNLIDSKGKNIRIMLTIGKKIIKLEKFHTDVLGNIYKINKEHLQFEY